MVFWVLLLGVFGPRGGYSEALVAAVEEAQYVPSEDVADVFHPGHAGSVWLHRPVGHMKTSIHYRYLVFFRGVLKEKKNGLGTKNFMGK